MAKKKFNASLDEELILALKMQALIEDRDASSIIEQLLREYLEKRKQAEPHPATSNGR
jgi:hypothetical protein